MKTIKVYYNKNLKMTEGKLAAQCSHAVAGLVNQIGYDSNCKIIILEARQKKFYDLFAENVDKSIYMQVDLGYNEVKSNTETAFAYLEEETQIK